MTRSLYINQLNSLSISYAYAFACQEEVTGGSVEGHKILTYTTTVAIATGLLDAVAIATRPFLSAL